MNLSLNNQIGPRQRPTNVKAASFCLARVSGLSAQPLNQLILEGTVQLIRSALATEAAMQALVANIEEALYRQVPLAGEDNKLRRRILAVRRNVHNSRLWPEAASDISAVISVLRDISARDRLWNWYSLACKRAAIMEQAATTFIQEQNRATRSLTDNLSNIDLQQGLALASPGLLQELGRAAKSHRLEDLRPCSKLARSSLSYLIRATLKTSPFSKFTHLAMADFEPSGKDDKQARDVQSATQAETANVTKLAQVLPVSWLFLMARDSDLATVLSFEPNPGLYRHEGELGKVLVLTTKYTLYNTFAWREESLIEREFDSFCLPSLSHFLEKGQHLTYLEMINLLRDMGSIPNAHQALVQLLDMQLVRPVAPYAQGDSQPIHALARTLAKMDNERAASIVELMDDVQQKAHDSRTADATTRLQTIEQVRQSAVRIFEILKAEPPHWLKTTNLIFEDMRFTGSVITLSRQVQSDLEQVAEILRTRVVRTKMYDYLYRYFVQRFGPDGETDNILEFLHDFSTHRSFPELTARARAEDYRALTEQRENEPASLPTGYSAIPLALTVFFQLAAESAEALEQGDYKFVVNQVVTGQGGILGRFANLLGPGQGDLVSKLEGYINSIYGERIVLETPVVSDWSNLQPVVGISKKVLQWPGEISTSEAHGGRDNEEPSTLLLRELRLRANPEDNTLYLVDRADQVVAPTYMGAVPCYLIHHALGLFLMLLDPWTSNFSIGRHYERFQPISSNPDEVEFFPRQEQGRIVLRRARWRFPVDHIPMRVKGESDFEFFLRVQRWRATHNLPEEVFAEVEMERLPAEHLSHKPMWIHFCSPHTLELLCHMRTKPVKVITLTEVLPSRHQHWVEAPASVPDVVCADASVNGLMERRLSEFVGLVHWPMPILPNASRSIHNCRKNQTAVVRRDDDWLYFNVYPAKSDQMDEVIRYIVGPALELARADSELERWFFIRYIDERGPHIRLRLQGPSRLRDRLRDEVGILIERVLPLLKSEQMTRRLLPLNSALPDPVQAWPGYSIGQYEPEYIKYGGQVGVTIAERLFEASSELALKIITLEPQQELDRMLLSLRLIQLVVEEMHLEPDAQHHFLSYYLWYWSGQDQQDADCLRTSFQQGARQRRTYLLEQLTKLSLNPIVQSWIDEYKVAVSTTIQALSAAAHKVSEPIISLCFDYIHMNNNRLGVLPLEEAYLTALLEAFMGTKQHSAYEVEGWSNME